MKFSKLFIAAIACASLSLASCTNSQGSATPNVDQANSEAIVKAIGNKVGVVELEDDNLIRPDSKVEKLTILDFNAVWCGPCKKLTPSFRKAAEEYAGEVWFVGVDVDHNPNTAQAFGVQGIPQVTFISPDGAVQSFVGLDPFLSSDFDYANATTEQLNDEIYSHLSDYIKSKLNK